MTATVSQLALAPVKGMRVIAMPELEIGPTGAVGDRAFSSSTRSRGKDDVAFGLWCDVVRPGRVRVGDTVLLPG